MFKPFRLALLISACGSAAICAQDFPTKTVRIVTGPAGGPGDFAARQIAQGISPGLGQQVVVDNRSAGTAPGEAVAKAIPDGYTLLSTGATIWVGPLLQKTPYDGITDFAPVALVSRAPLVLVVHPSLPLKSVRELVALAKSNPGALNYASGGTGGTSHLAGEMFKAFAGVNIVRVFYKSGATQMADLLSGEVQLTFGPAVEMLPQVKAGKLKILAVTSTQPSPLVPGAPTISSSGVPGYEMGSVTGMFAPAKIPTSAVSRLNREITRFLALPETKERLLNNGVEAVGGSPEDLGNLVKSEVARIGKVIREAGIRVE